MFEKENQPAGAIPQWHVERFFVLSSELLCVVGFDGYFKAINPVFEEEIGNNENRLFSQLWLEWIHPEDQESTQSAIKQLSPTHAAVSFEARLLKQNGSYQRFRWKLAYENDLVFHAVLQPIHEPTTADSPVAYLNHLLTDAPAGMVILHGPRLVYTLVNELYEKISGHSKFELLGRSLREVFPELEANGVFQMFDGIYQTGEPFIAQEFYAAFDHTGQGFLQEGYYNFVAAPIKNKFGQVTDVLIHIYEVTEYVRARQKLKESEEQFRAIFDQSAAGIMETDLAGQFILVNDRFCDIMGYSREELLQKRVIDLTHPDDVTSSEKYFERAVNDGEKLLVEKRYIRKGGETIWVRNSVSAVRDINGEIKNVMAVSFDITAVREAEEALLERQREKAVADERQRLARELHDSVTQALFSAGVITQAIPRLLEAQPDKAKTQLDNLNELITGASSELRTLLWELRPDKIAQTGLASLLTQLAYAVQARKPIKVFLRIHGDQERFLPPAVLMTFYRIAQEGINNIIKHSNASKIRVRMRRTEDYVMMSIMDDGQGFDLDTSKPGFGLMIMGERAEEAGAQLDIRSRPGKGTRIRLFWQGESEARIVIGEST